MCRKKGSSFISSLSCRKRLVITFLTAWHLMFWSWYPLNFWLTNMTGIWKTRNGISLLSTEIHDFGICFVFVWCQTLSWQKSWYMLTSRMKSIWISFDCDQASHSAVVLWDVQWAEAPHADAQRNHPLHPSPPRITRLKRPFGGCHPSKPKNSSFHHHQTVMYLFPKLHPPEFRTISRWRHGDVKKTPLIISMEFSNEVQGLQRRLFAFFKLNFT